jgi:hypothetical protein
MKSGFKLLAGVTLKMYETGLIPRHWTSAQFCKTSSVYNLQISIISLSACWTGLEKLARDKHSNKLINYTQKRIIAFDQAVGGSKDSHSNLS